MKKNNDQLIRAITADGNIRAIAINGTFLCDKVRKMQNTAPTASAALGRVLCATAMLGANIKEGEEISLRIVGDGPAQGIIGQGNPNGTVRGYIVNPKADLPSKNGKLDVAGIIGEGNLYVTRELGMKNPYTGQVPLQTGEIGDDLAYYFLKSEQTPSAVGVGVLVDVDCSVIVAGGYIIQALPGASEAAITLLEYNIMSSAAPTQLFAELITPEKVLSKLLDGFSWSVIGEIKPQFKCKCSKEKARGVLATLGAVELRQMINDKEDFIVSCEMCGKSRSFTPDEVENIISRLMKKEV
jgi:molecular chaperone Hsp33